MHTDELNHGLPVCHAVLCAMLLCCLSAWRSAEASGLDCTLALHAPDEAPADMRPSKDLLDQMTRAHGLGVLSGWTFARLGGTVGKPAPALGGDADWSGLWITHPREPGTDEPIREILGSFEIEARSGQPWLVWRVDISEPCAGRTDFPLASGTAPVLRMDTAEYHRAVIKGISFDVPRPPHDRNDWVEANWDAALPILSSISLSREGETCRAGYGTPEGHVVLQFVCKRMTGE